MNTGLKFVLDHWELFGGVAAMLASAVYAYGVRIDGIGMTRLESLPLFHAHPKAAVVLERANVLLLGALKVTAQVAVADVTKSSAPNGRQVAEDIEKQLIKEFGPGPVSAVSKVQEGVTLVDHLEAQVNTFNNAPGAAAEAARRAGSIALVSDPKPPPSAA